MLPKKLLETYKSGVPLLALGAFSKIFKSAYKSICGFYTWLLGLSPFCSLFTLLTRVTRLPAMSTFITFFRTLFSSISHSFYLALFPFRKLFEFLFPDCCIICSTREELSEYNMCKSCKSEVHLLADCSHCYCCGRKMINSNLCIICETSKPKFDEAKAIFVYNRHIATFIRRIKFNDGTFLTKLLAEIIMRHFREDLKNCDFIIPVPIHRIRLIKRQYNQSCLIAMQLAKLMNIAVRFDVLCKVKNTPSQLSLSMEERKENLHGAFAVRNSAGIRGAFIVLLDDVITTGTTASRCAEALSQHNPRRIVVISIARAILYK